MKNSPNTTASPGRRRKLALASTLTIGTIGVVAGGFGGSASAIVDGEATSVSANPWQVALTSPDGSQFCGGSIVSDRVIVTAAHCTQGQDESDISIRAGVTDLDSDDGQTRDVTKVIEHPKYVDGVGDIAMLVLDAPLDLGNDVQPIALATADQIASATTARVTGWGVTDENADDTPSVLQSTDVPMISDEDCSLVDVGNDDELCAGGTGTDSCYGDSGGPLTIATDNGQALAGVVSWGEQCGDDLGGVYAEVPTFATWVAERIADPDAPAGDRLPVPEYGEGEEGDDVIEIEQDFIDSLGDEIDTLSDDEFWDRYQEYLDQNGDADDEIDDPSDDQTLDDDMFGDVDIDAMTDEEFQEYIDGLSDEEFDQLIQDWEVLDDADFDDADFEMDDDTSTDDMSWADYDVNDDGVVQWTELAELAEF